MHLACCTTLDRRLPTLRHRAIFRQYCASTPIAILRNRRNYEKASLATPNEAATDQLRSPEACRSKPVTTHQIGQLLHIEPHGVPCNGPHSEILRRPSRNTQMHSLSLHIGPGWAITIPRPTHMHGLISSLLAPDKWAEPMARQRGVRLDARGC